MFIRFKAKALLFPFKLVLVISEMPCRLTMKPVDDEVFAFLFSGRGPNLELSSPVASFVARGACSRRHTMC